MAQGRYREHVRTQCNLWGCPSSGGKLNILKSDARSTQGIEFCTESWQSSSSWQSISLNTNVKDEM